ncbi:MAG TPA: chorismate mutase [Thermoplasmata archaeon]|nr:chorismate mutase [Thermoplasmata archaeon]
MTAGRSYPPADGATWAVREKLRAVDVALVELLAARFRLVGQLWAHKAAVGLPFDDPVRERDALRVLRNEGLRVGLAPEFVEGLFRSVIDEGKRTARSQRRSARVRPSPTPAGTRSLAGRPGPALPPSPETVRPA